MVGAGLDQRLISLKLGVGRAVEHQAEEQDKRVGITVAGQVRVALAFACGLSSRIDGA